MAWLGPAIVEKKVELDSGRKEGDAVLNGPKYGEGASRLTRGTCDDALRSVLVFGLAVKLEAVWAEKDALRAEVSGTPISARDAVRKRPLAEDDAPRSALSSNIGDV